MCAKISFTKQYSDTAMIFSEKCIKSRLVTISLFYGSLAYSDPCVSLKQQHDETQQAELTELISKLSTKTISGENYLETLDRDLLAVLAQQKNDLKVRYERRRSQLVDSPPKDQVIERFTVDSREVAFHSLPEAVTKSPSRLVFYGRPAVGYEESIGNVRALFRQGRKRPEGAHVDVAQHAQSTRNEPSSFIQTTATFAIAHNFAIGQSVEGERRSRITHGTLFIIDADNAPVIFIPELYRALHLGVPRFNAEKEVLFIKELDPRRIMAGMIIDVKDSSKPVEILLNPNYEARTSNP